MTVSGSGDEGPGEETLQTVRVSSEAALGLTWLLCLAFLTTLDDSITGLDLMEHVVGLLCPGDPGQGP